MALNAVFTASFDRFEASMKSATVQAQTFDRAIKNSQRDLKREVESFSGQKIAVESARMVEAVNRLGGVSKLTDTELRRLTGTLNEAAQKAGLMGDALSPSIAKMRTEIERLPKPVNDSAQGLGKFGSILNDIAGRAGPLGPALQGVIAGGVAAIGTAAITAGAALAQMAVQGLGELLRRGSQIASMGEGFRALAGGVQNATAVMESMRSGTRGLVADLDIMQASNKAMLLGLGLNAKQMGDLAQTATVLGRAMGQDATKSLDDLITALGRSSPLILDNLGLTVKVGEANERYAAKLGRSADSLTDAEKKQAFMNAAMEAAESRVATLGTGTLTLADRWDQLATSISNATGRLGEWLAKSLNAGLFNPTDIREFTKAQREMLAEGIKNGENFITVLARVRGQLRTEDIKLPGAKVATEEQRDFVKELAAVNAKIRELTPAMRAQIDAAMKLGAVTDAQAKAWGLTAAEVRLYQSSVKDATKDTKDASTWQLQWANAQQTFQKEMKASAKSLSDFIDKINIKALTKPDDMVKTAERWTKPLADAIISNVKMQRQYQAELTTLVQTRTLGRVDFQIAQIDKWAKNEKATLDRNAGAWKENLATIDAIARERINALIEADEVAQRVLFANLDTDAANKSLSKVIGGGLMGVLDGLAGTLARAFEGGGGLIGAFKAIGVQVSDAITKPIIERMTKVTRGAYAVGVSAATAIGGAVGGGAGATVAGLASGLGGAALAASAMGKSLVAAGIAGNVALAGMTAGIGLAAVGIFKLIQHNRNLNKEVKEWNKKIDETRVKLLEMYGPLDALDKKAKALGLHSFTSEWFHQGEKGAAQFAVFIKEFEARLKKTNDSFAPLLSSATELGIRLPAAILASIEQLRELGILSAENAALLDQLAGAAEVDWKKMQEAAERYGIDLDSLGQKFQGLKFGDAAKQIINDFDLLSRGGADVGGILFGMQDEISALVQQAKKFGLDIPKNMQPWIEELLRAGLLTDENGEMLKDIAGIRFAAPIKTEFERITEALEKLIETLNLFASTLGNLPKPDVTFPSNPNPHGGEFGGTSPWSPAALTPGETVLGRGATHDFLQGVRDGSGAQTINVPISLDGRVIADVVIERVGNRLSVKGAR